MGFIHVVVALLGLLSGGQSAPVTGCESLTQHVEIQGREQLLGKWVLIAESTNIKGSKLLTKMFVDNAWARITAAIESDTLSVFQTQKMFGRCFSITFKTTLENNTLSVVHPFLASEILLNTGCPDCLVIRSNYTLGGSTYRGLQLLSRRNNVTAAELEEFTKQIECLSLPPPAILDPQKGLCPDESPSQETETTDLTDIWTDLNPDVFSMLDRFISTDDGLKNLIKMISTGLAGLKET